MSSEVFTSLSSKKIAHLIAQARYRVIFASPGLNHTIATAIIEYSKQYRSSILSILLDCDDNACRLGYGDAEAIRLLLDSGTPVRQCSGLRIGVLICDTEAWTFSPPPLCVEGEPRSYQSPNAVSLLPAQAEAILDAIRPTSRLPDELFGFDKQNRNEVAAIPEVGITEVTPQILDAIQQSLAVAPPLHFDLQRQVRVFQPYIQYVELRLTGCSIQKHTVQIPSELTGLTNDAAVRERLRTTFNLISESSKLSDKTLQDELERIRRTYTPTLGKTWGRVMLRSKRTQLDAQLDALEAKVQKFADDVQANLKVEIDRSILQLVKAFLPLVLQSPPDTLMAGVTGAKPTREEAKRWLEFVLQRAFPKPEAVLSDMKMERVFKDLTYETLNEKGLQEALQKAFPAVAWDKPFHEFEAARESPQEDTAGTN